MNWRSSGVATLLAIVSDRKSTRLNSSHLGISYAVFCLKKKKYDEHAANFTIASLPVMPRHPTAPPARKYATIFAHGSRRTATSRHAPRTRDARTARQVH